MQRKFKCSIIAATTSAILIATGTVANAAGPSEDLSAMLATTPGSERVISAPDENASNASVTLPEASGDTLDFAHPDGTWLKIGLPENANYARAVDSPAIDEPLVTAQRIAPVAASAATQASSPPVAISARAVVAVPDSKAPSSYDFELELPKGIVPTLKADGSVQFVLESKANTKSNGTIAEATFGEIKKPWAEDAAGNPVPTSFSLKGNTLTQSIDFSADTKFPVLADPEAEWKGFYGRLTYSKAETANMRDQGVVIAGLLAGSAGIATMFGPGAPIVGAILAGASATAVGIISATASNAHNDGRCLQVDIPPLVNPAIVDCRS